jgi:peptidoglycan hydrolase-like protein with peptidoglycan-binding domain
MIEYGEYYDGDNGTRTVKLGDQGKDVKTIQRYFGLEDDGYYGPITEAKVKEWQPTRDLEADGVFGIKSWNELRRVLDNF